MSHNNSFSILDLFIFIVLVAKATVPMQQRYELFLKYPKILHTILFDSALMSIASPRVYYWPYTNSALQSALM